MEEKLKQVKEIINDAMVTKCLTLDSVSLIENTLGKVSLMFDLSELVKKREEIKTVYAKPLIDIKKDDHMFNSEMAASGKSVNSEAKDFYNAYRASWSKAGQSELELIDFQLEHCLKKAKQLCEMYIEFDDIKTWQFITKTSEDFFEAQDRLPLKYIFWPRFWFIVLFPIKGPLWLIKKIRSRFDPDVIASEPPTMSIDLEKAFIEAEEAKRKVAEEEQLKKEQAEKKAAEKAQREKEKAKEGAK